MPSFEIQADIFTRLSVFDSPKGSSNTFKTHKNISLYFKRRYLIIYNYQDILSYTSSKVDYSVRENIYMLLSDTNLNIRSGTAGYNNKILVSDKKFSLGKNDEVNAPAMKSHKILAQTTNSNEVQAQKPTITQTNQEPQTHSQRGKNCSGTFSGRWFYNMEYVLVVFQ